MEVSYLGLALYADMSPDGRLSMIGGQLDTLHCPEFPVVSGTPLYVVGIINYTSEEAERVYPTRILIVSDAGEEIFHADNDLEASIRPAPGRFSRMSFVILISHLMIARAGQYSIRLVVDDLELKRIPLYAELQVAAPTRN